MKKIIAVSISILILSGCAINKGTNKYINKKIGIDISKCKIEKDKDTHGGFLGDGYYIVIANCEQKPLAEIKEWKKLPLSQNLQLIMYGGTKDDSTYLYNLAEESGIPEIKNGYYYFYDRVDGEYFKDKNTDTEKKIEDRHSDSEIFNRYSYNFTLALYDEDNNKFYYYEFDT